jgi:nitroreductase
MAESRFLPLTTYREYPASEMVERAAAFYQDLKRRRTVRQFSDRPVPPGVIEYCLRAATTAPSGANSQPYHFVTITDPDIKRQIREAAEEQERAFYQRRAPEEWLEMLAALGTDAHKPFLQVAPCLIAIFVRRYAQLADGRRVKLPYAVESVGIATGMLVAAIHHAGLVTLPYTPSPMGFLNKILGRPASERPFVLLIVGYPADDATVPDLRKKALEEVVTFS